jgi:hypothetical protein
VIQPERLDVTGEMVDRDQRAAQRPGDRLRERHANEQRADEPRPLRDRNRIDIGPTPAGIRQRSLDHAADVPNVLARGQLGDHATPLAVNGHLRRDDAGAYVPRMQWRRVFHEGGGCFVARRFDTQHQHGLWVRVQGFRVQGSGFGGSGVLGWLGCSGARFRSATVTGLTVRRPPGSR